MSLAVHRASLEANDVGREFETIVGELLRYDPERGLNLWGDAPDPVMLVWSPRIYEFLEVIEGVTSYPPARGICREVGYRSGFDGAVESKTALKIEERGDVGVLLAMPTVLAGAGWGVSELTYDDEAGSLQWTFPKGTAVGVAAARRGREGAPACAFFEGFGAGWVKGSVGLEVEFLESECAGLKLPTCTFQSRSLR